MDRSRCLETCPVLTRAKFYHRQQNHDLFTGTMPSQKNLTDSYRNALKPWKRKIESDERQLVPSFKGKHPTCAQFEKNELLDESQSCPTCAQFECNLASVLFACDEVFFTTPSVTHSVFIMCNTEGYSIFLYRQTFSIVLLQSHLHIFVNCCIHKYSHI